MKKIPFSIFSRVVWMIVLVGLGIYAEHSYQIYNRVLATSPAHQFSSSNNPLLPYNTTPRLSGEARKVDLNTMWEVWNYLDEYYIAPENITTDAMINGAISGMTASLDDPYTMYLPPEENQRSAEDLAGSFYGVGIELGYVDGVLAAIAPLAGSPAEKAGVEPGDLIIRVKDVAKDLDEATTGWSLYKAVNTIRGPQKTPVVLTLFRQDDATKLEPFEVTIIRDEIIVKSVELEFVAQGDTTIAHIKLSRFGERTIDEWDQAVTAILARGNAVSGVILDMRNNPGGFFNDAIYIASEFIADGVVVKQKGRSADKDYMVDGKARLTGKPVQVLLNRGSASASEIVAGALRDRVGSTLIGEKTFGKGTVQDRRMLSNGAGLHVTVARWMLPGGDWIHDEGLPVEIEVVDDRGTEADEALQKAIEQF